MRKVPVRRADGNVVKVAFYQGHIFVCGHGLCCGRTAQGYAPAFLELHQREWQRRKLGKTVYLTQSGCLGCCVLANVVLLLFDRRALWFHSFKTEEQIIALYDYVEAMVQAKQLLPVPDALCDHVVEGTESPKTYS